MNYVCLKRLTAGGVEYLPGDPIPGEAILSGRVRALISSGMIAEADVEFQTPDAELASEVGSDFVMLELPGEGSTISLRFDQEQLQRIVNTMILGAKDAANEIEDEVDENVLIFIQKVDSRKTVKEAVQKQMTIISNLRGDSEAPQGQNEPETGTGEETGDKE